MQLPRGFQVVDIVTESRAEDSLTWSEDELVSRLAETRQFGSAQEVIVCGWCEEKRRCRAGKGAERDAIDWFHSHPCSKDFAEPSTGETRLQNENAPERGSALAA